MILDLREFETFPVKTLLKGNPGEPDIDFDGLNNVKQVELNLNIQKSSDEYYCQGEVHAEVSLECSRCLVSFDAHLDGETDFIICGKDAREAKDGIIDDEDYVFLRGNDLQADITEVIRQAIILEIGIKPLCSDNCLGICSQCGANLNKGNCSCGFDEIDERWESLRKLSDR